jgi:tetratricopeptide (TPR) repeat protein
MDNKEMSEREMWLALPTAEKEEKAELLLGLAREAHQRGAGNASLELARAALDTIEAMGELAPSGERAQAHCAIAWSHKGMDQLPEAIAELDKAISIYRETSSPILTNVLSTRSIWCGILEDWEGNLAGHLENLRIHEVEGDREWIAKGWFNIGVSYNALERHHDARDAFLTSRGFFVELKMIPEIARVDRWITETYVALGDGERAYEYARKALNVAELSQDRGPLMWSELMIGKALLTLCNYEDAERYFAKGYSRAISVDESEIAWDYVVELEEERIKLLKATGRNDQAAEIEARIATVKETYSPAKDNSSNVNSGDVE